MAYDSYFDNDKYLERWRKERVKDIPQEKKIDYSKTKKISQETLEAEKRARSNSINNTVIEYKPKVKKTTIRFISCCLAILIFISTIILGAGKISKRFQELALEDEIDDYVVEMISPEKEYGDILAYSAYRLKNGNFAYDHKLLAKEFLKCDASLFDLLIYNVYENDVYDKISDVNYIFQEISFILPSIESENPELFQKLNGINSFSKYLRTIDCVNEKDEIDYEKYEQYGKSLYESHKEDLKSQYGGKSK